METQERRKVELPGAKERECSSCGCKHLIVVGTESRFGKATIERLQCRHCAKVMRFTVKKSDAA
jgi:RNase P subunit RPR2